MRVSRILFDVWENNDVYYLGGIVFGLSKHPTSSSSLFSVLSLSIMLDSVLYARLREDDYLDLPECC